MYLTILASMFIPLIYIESWIHGMQCFFDKGTVSALDLFKDETSVHKNTTQEGNKKAFNIIVQYEI